MNTISDNILMVKKTIKESCEKSKRNTNSVQLVAVSKKQPMTRILEALEAGHRLYGENRIQEATEHWENLRAQYNDLCLHLIGPLQTNKVKEAVSLFDVIETVDRPKLVKHLATEAKKQNKAISCYIQVNTGEEEQKSGVRPKDLPSLLKLCHSEGLNITGLMCIPPKNDLAPLHFAFLKKLAAQYNLPNLSMGMSNDFDKAIPLGATHIRVGTAFFGERPVEIK